MTTFHSSLESELQPSQLNECPGKPYENSEISTTSTNNENTRQLESIGETRDDVGDEKENSISLSLLRHISHLENRLITETSELNNREAIAANLLQRIKIMESSSQTTAEVANDGIIDSHKMDIQLTIFNADTNREEITDHAQQIRFLEKKLAVRTKSLITKNDLIVDLLCHIFMLESGYLADVYYEDDIPSNESVVFVEADGGDNDGEFILSRKGNENKASQIIGMSIDVVKKSTKQRNMRKKAILLEAIAEVENESSSDEESSNGSAIVKNSVSDHDSIDTYTIQEVASHNLIEYIFCSMVENNGNVCNC